MSVNNTNLKAIKAVLWDFGGVLTTSPFEAFNRFEVNSGLPKDIIRTINSTNPDTNAWAQLESASIQVDEFDNIFAAEAKALGHEIRGRQVLALLSGDVRIDMVNALKKIKTKFQVACITNNVKTGTGPGMATDSKRVQGVAAVMELFDLVVESSKVGVRKPDPKIYQFTCESIGVSADECVFLDDLGINLKPAKALGMRTIKVVDPESAIAELEGHLDMKLS
ncbi:MAG: putative hydrolase of the HAD superfamily [Candidatus Azotimanducaceae bacterium]|jgi:putative hydrolase of the HAD superfamily